MNNHIVQFAVNKLKQKPEVATSPLGQQFINILQTNDVNAGVEMANNLLNSYGLTKEQGIQQARNGFHI